MLATLRRAGPASLARRMRPLPRSSVAATALQQQAGVSGSTLTEGTMYNWRVRAVDDALAKAGKADGPLSVEDLCALGHLDQYHYLGTEACDEVAELLGLTTSSTLLDVGSGIGGPARYLAATTGCSVVGIELQADLGEAAAALTARVPGLSDRVRFATGCATDPALPIAASFLSDNGFDHAMSLLVNLHAPDRETLLAAMHARLKPGATFVIEDFAALAPLESAEADTLLNLVKAPSVSSVSAYVAELESVGFVDIDAFDMSPVWTEWCAARSDQYMRSEADAVALHGRAIFESRAHFYQAIADLFAGGRVGGVRLTGRKPTEKEATLTHARRRLARKAAAQQAPRGVRILENGAAFHKNSPS